MVCKIFDVPDDEREAFLRGPCMGMGMPTDRLKDALGRGKCRLGDERGGHSSRWTNGQNNRQTGTSMELGASVNWDLGRLGALRPVLFA
jgi:hypothetical protein